MKIAIVHSVAGLSSKELGDFLRDPGFTVDVVNPNHDGTTNFKAYDWVFNYGYGGGLFYKNIINTPQSVCNCVYKDRTFAAMHKAKVHTVEYCVKKSQIPKHWDWVVVRKATDGRKAEDLAFYENKPKNIPNGALFTEYFEHTKEYRVVIFKNRLVGIYFKEEDNKGTWHFMVQNPKGFELMTEHCIKAAKALHIDYVGFDVVCKTKTNFRILEANSAPILTREAMEMVWKFFNGYKF